MAAAASLIANNFKDDLKAFICKKDKYIVKYTHFQHLSQPAFLSKVFLFDNSL